MSFWKELTPGSKFVFPTGNPSLQHCPRQAWVQRISYFLYKTLAQDCIKSSAPLNTQKRMTFQNHSAKILRIYKKENTRKKFDWHFPNKLILLSKPTDRLAVYNSHQEDALPWHLGPWWAEEVRPSHLVRILFGEAAFTKRIDRTVNSNALKGLSLPG